jgi:hypothetical protein
MQIAAAKHLLPLATLCAFLATTACSTTESTRAKSLEGASTQPTTLADCQHLTVLDFGMPASVKAKHAAVGSEFARGIKARLSADFGPIFQTVENGAAARGLDHECLVRGEITKYKPGSRVGRAIVGFLAPASLEGGVRVTSASGDAVLLSAPFDKLWAWGGIAGASKGIGDMVEETSASVAATIARAKGWTPPPK